MIIYITGPSGSGKTTLIKMLPIKSFDLDDLYEKQWKKTNNINKVLKYVKDDIQKKIEKYKNIVFVGLQGKDDLLFKPDTIIILERTDYETFYRQKLVRDLHLLCRDKSDIEDVFKNKPFSDFRNYVWSNSVVNLKSLDDFIKDVKKMYKAIKKDFPKSINLEFKDIPKYIKSII